MLTYLPPSLPPSLPRLSPQAAALDSKEGGKKREAVKGWIKDAVSFIKKEGTATGA